ncbi:hypothetical protein TeGR_g9271 [Tetraparma gracilis]|jgi:hypothetical protein|uniref:Uncharacterized protein n=1 Tax=Tetraparma gracilis TaxID=2962635 RepID=A0ABQ6MWJ9_9STRA|nr:hypothetical protein TeGR_g9271 [Tetraparma gracilis]
MPSITARFESMTGLDIDGDGVSGEVPPTYTVLSTGYSTFKTVWAASKNYQLVSTATGLAETVATKVVSIAAKTDLAAIDAKLSPAFAKADRSVSPMVENTLKFGEKKVKDLEPVINVVKVVVPVKTATAVSASLYGIFLKNLEKVGQVMLIENPEVTN